MKFIVEFTFGPNTRLICPENHIGPLIRENCSVMMEELTSGEIPAVNVIPAGNCSVVLSESELQTLAENA